MKRLGSWVLLLLCVFCSILIINFSSVLSVSIIESMYYNNRGLFWVIVFFGGSFGLGLIFYISYMGAYLSSKWSNKVYRTLKGGRYTVFGVLIIAFFAFDLVYVLIERVSFSSVASEIVYCIFDIIFGIFLIVFGKELPSEENHKYAEKIHKEIFTSEERPKTETNYKEIFASEESRKAEDTSFIDVFAAKKTETDYKAVFASEETSESLTEKYDTQEKRITFCKYCGCKLGEGTYEHCRYCGKKLSDKGTNEIFYEKKEERIDLNDLLEEKNELVQEKVFFSKEQLKELKDIYEEGLIEKEEFEAKKRQILGL